MCKTDLDELAEWLAHYSADCLPLLRGIGFDSAPAFLRAVAAVIPYGEPTPFGPLSGWSVVYQCLGGYRVLDTSGWDTFPEDGEPFASVEEALALIAEFNAP